MTPAAPGKSPNAGIGRTAGERTPPRDRPARRQRGRGPKRTTQPTPKRLIDTPGPDPATPLEETRLVVGRVIGTHGVRGELKVAILTDDPEHMASLKRLWLGIEKRPRTVLGVRFHAGNALVRLSGITTPEEGLTYRGQPLWMAGADAKPLPPGEFRLYQLVGLRALTEDGRVLGRVADILETGAHDVFVITPEGGGSDLLLPYHPSVILDIRPDEGRMVVRPLLYWDDAPIASSEDGGLRTED